MDSSAIRKAWKEYSQQECSPREEGQLQAAAKGGEVGRSLILIRWAFYAGAEWQRKQFEEKRT